MATDSNGIGDSVIVELQSGDPAGQAPPEVPVDANNKNVNPDEQPDG